MGRSSLEGIDYPFQYSWASLVAQLVKNLPAVRETWVQSLVCEDPLEKGKATNSSILARIILFKHFIPVAVTHTHTHKKIHHKKDNLYRISSIT